MKQETVAYVAGIFDGEGCVDIYTATASKASKSPSLLLRVNIAQKDGRLMHWLVENFGGYVQTSKGRQMYHWELRSKAAEQFLLNIYPYLVVKKDQAIVAIDFIRYKDGYLKTLKGHQKFRTLTQEEIDKRLEYKLRLQALKKVHPPYIKNDGTGSTTEREDS